MAQDWVLAVTVITLAFMSCMAGYIFSRHYRYWRWSGDVRWQYHRLGTAREVIRKMKREIREMEDNPPGLKHPKKVKEYQNLLAQRRNTVDTVEWDLAEIKMALEKLLEDGPT